MKWGYFAMTKFFGKEPSEEGLKEVTDSMQALNDLRYKVPWPMKMNINLND